MASLRTGKLLYPRTSELLQHVRNIWIKKIKVDVYPSFQERLAERDETKRDPELHSSVNIGFAAEKKSRKEQLFQRIEKLKSVKQNAALEKLAKKRLLKVDLSSVQEEWRTTGAPEHIRVLAGHYGIYNDLFGNAYFVPRVYLSVSYDYDEDTVSLVHRGNTIKPSEAACQPHVEFTSKADDLWTLVMTNPDGNLYDNKSECLHWLVGNIPGGDLSKGEVICDYLQPFPPRGTGYQRVVFMLYKQERHLDYSKYQKPAPCLQLGDRTFSTLDFYRELQDDITPAGLAWFQSDWDSSVTDVFHHTLHMREPVYEYDFPEPLLNPPKYFPLKKQFNTYLDMHRDPKQINKEILLERLKKINPLEPEPPVLPYPAAIPVDKRLSWERKEVKKQRLGVGKYRDLFRGHNRPPQVLEEYYYKPDKKT